MPWRARGKVVEKLKGGRWIRHQVCKSEENAKRAVRLLRGIEHGMKPRKRRPK